MRCENGGRRRPTACPPPAHHITTSCRQTSSALPRSARAQRTPTSRSSCRSCELRRSGCAMLLPTSSTDHHCSPFPSCTPFHFDGHCQTTESHIRSKRLSLSPISSLPRALFDELPFGSSSQASPRAVTPLLSCGPAMNWRSAAGHEAGIRKPRDGRSSRMCIRTPASPEARCQHVRL